MKLVENGFLRLSSGSVSCEVLALMKRAGRGGARAEGRRVFVRCRNGSLRQGAIDANKAGPVRCGSKYDTSFA
jgi:hypothetical protein